LSDIFIQASDAERLPYFKKKTRVAAVDYFPQATTQFIEDNFLPAMGNYLLLPEQPDGQLKRPEMIFYK